MTQTELKRQAKVTAKKLIDQMLEYQLGGAESKHARERAKKSALFALGLLISGAEKSDEALNALAKTFNTFSEKTTGKKLVFDKANVAEQWLAVIAEVQKYE